MMIKQPIATAATAYDSALDLDSVAMSLLAKLEDQPDLIIASYSSLCDATELINHLR
jgi:galactitol-specific phosphotransferase system IIB component